MWATAALALGTVVGLAPLAAAGEFTLEGFGAFGTGTKTADLDFKEKFSGGGGIGWEVARNLQLRADVAAFSWDGSFTRTFTSTVRVCFQIGNLLFCTQSTSRGTSNITQKLKNTPVFVGGRYFIGSSKSWRPFVELGAGISPVKLEVTTVTGSSTRLSEEKGTKVGAIPGAGLEYRFGKKVGVGVGGRYYYVPKGVGDADDVESSFFSAMASLVVHF